MHQNDILIFFGFNLGKMYQSYPVHAQTEIAVTLRHGGELESGPEDLA